MTGYTGDMEMTGKTRILYRGYAMFDIASRLEQQPLSGAKPHEHEKAFSEPTCISFLKSQGWVLTECDRKGDDQFNDDHKEVRRDLASPRDLLGVDLGTTCLIAEEACWIWGTGGSTSRTTPEPPCISCLSGKESVATEPRN